MALILASSVCFAVSSFVLTLSSSAAVSAAAFGLPEVVRQFVSLLQPPVWSSISAAVLLHLFAIQQVFQRLLFAYFGVY
ncbi:MAG: hypothetical protein ACLR7U_06360 [Ruthenibacterium lactatiformans]